MFRWGRLLLCCFAALALLAALAAAGAPKGVLLQYHQGEGDRASYDYSATLSAKLALNDGTLTKIHSSLRMKNTAEFLGLSGDGTLRVQAEVNSGTIKVTAQGKTETSDVEPVMACYDLFPCGEIKYRELASGQAVTAPGLFAAFAPDDSFLIGGVGIFPKKPVKVGEAWKGVVNLPTLSGDPGETVQVKYESKLLGQTSYLGRACYKVKTDYRAFQRESQEVPEISGSVLVKAKVTGSTTWLFDPEQGLIMKADGTDNLTATALVDMAAEGQNELKVTGTFEEHTKLIEYNGRAVVAK